MKIERDYNLHELNTFGISANAKFFAEIHNEQDLKELFTASEFENGPKVFLGGGSNVLFTKDFDGIVVLNKLKGVEILEENSDIVVVRAMGGEIWHDLVVFAAERGLWGIENLSLIPGTVGAAPMQNIGAYGAELADVLLNVEAYEIETGEKRIFKKEECELGYRDSIFKNKLKDKYFISAATLELRKKDTPNVSYKILREHLENNKIEPSNPKTISEAVAFIRRTKLPDPADIPNAGSFFKNVFVEPAILKKLQKSYPEMPFFVEGGLVKIPAAWFIEQAGPEDGASWKGYRVGNVGVHEKQALVLVNHGGATGEEIKNLAERIMADVKQKFGLTLIPEVNLI